MRSYEARRQVHEPLHPLHREAFSARPNPEAGSLRTGYLDAVSCRQGKTWSLR
jgi:hypothetical protein